MYILLQLSFHDTFWNFEWMNLSPIAINVRWSRISLKMFYRLLIQRFTWWRTGGVALKVGCGETRVQIWHFEVHRPLTKKVLSLLIPVDKSLESRKKFRFLLLQMNTKTPKYAVVWPPLPIRILNHQYCTEVFCTHLVLWDIFDRNVSVPYFWMIVDGLVARGRGRKYQIFNEAAATRLWPEIH